MTDETNASESEAVELGADEVEVSSVRWYRRIKDWLWGYDFFISYHWASGGTYAVDLAAQLREKGYEVFLDRAEYAMGDKWKGVGEVALRNTKRLVLVATREAVFESKPVAREIVLFTDRSRHCIPIFFGDTFKDEEQAKPGKFVVLSRLPDDTLHIEDAIENLSRGPTPEVVENLAASHGIMRRRKLRTTITVIAISMLSTFLLVAVGAAIYARYQEGIAIQERDESEARRLATVAKANAAEQTDVAILLSLESLRVKETDEGWGALFSALSQPVFARSPLTGHQGKISQVAFSPDGKQIASAGDDGTIRLWEVASGSEVCQFTRHRHAKHPEIGIEVRAVTFSPDGRLMASGDSFGKVILWDVKSRTSFGEVLTGHTNAIKTLAFAADSSSLASAGLDNKGKGEVRLWRVGATGAQPGETLTGHSGEVRSVMFLGPTKLASAGLGGTVRVWDTVAGAETGHAIPPQNGWGGALQIGSGGKILAVANLDWSIQLWSLDTGERIGKPLAGHDREVSAAAFSGDKKLATASLDRTVRIWELDLESGEHRQIGKPLTGHKGEVSSVTFSPDNSLLATASLDGTVRLWDVATGPSVGALLTDRESLPLLALSHNEARLASANSNGMVRVWDLAAREMIFERQAHDSATSVALSPDGSRMASGGFDGSIQLWSVDPGGPRLLEPPTAHDNRITGLAFSPGKGAKLASACADGVVRLWDVELARAVCAPATGHDGHVPGLAFSTDGSRLVSAGYDGTLRLWDAGLTPVVSPLTGHEGVVWDVVFNSVGSELTSVSSDGTVRRWEFASAQIGEPVIRSPGQWVGTASFSPDGTRLATATSDGTLHLWDVSSGQQLGVPLTGHGSEVTGMAFSRGASLLASASSDGTLRLWPARDRWIELACETVGRNLSLAEWEKFVGANRPYQRQCAESPSGLGAPEVHDPEYKLQYKNQAN